VRVYHLHETLQNMFTFHPCLFFHNKSFLCVLEMSCAIFPSADAAARYLGGLPRTHERYYASSISTPTTIVLESPFYGSGVHRFGGRAVYHSSHEASNVLTCQSDVPSSFSHLITQTIVGEQVQNFPLVYSLYQTVNFETACAEASVRLNAHVITMRSLTGQRTLP
jgi:hypothetical protein